MGEIMFRGNITMKGYLKNATATDEAFAGGWYHTGDLAVIYPDGYVKIRDRSKDVIISGGENVSSLEVEDALYRHPAVAAAAVVAQPDPKWGETPCAFVELGTGVGGHATEAGDDRALPRAARGASRRRRATCSVRCRRRRPARSRSSCCAKRRSRRRRSRGGGEGGGRRGGGGGGEGEEGGGESAWEDMVNDHGDAGHDALRAGAGADDKRNARRCTAPTVQPAVDNILGELDAR